MGAVALVAMGGLFYLVNSLRSAFIRPNPVMEELEKRVLQAQRDAEAAEAERRRAEEEREWAQERQRMAEDEMVRAEEEVRRAEDERRRADDARRRAEEEARHATEERRRAEEDVRRADEERAKMDQERQAAEEERRRFEEKAKMAQEDSIRADEARRRAEEEARNAEDERTKAEEERRQAEEDKKHANEARVISEDQRRQAEEDRRMSEKERAKADESARKARFDQERAEQAKATADKAAADAQAALEEAERALKEGIKPVILPTPAEFAATMERLQYEKGLFHFAVAGISGSGKSSLINAFRGLQNSSQSPLVAGTGVVETTSEITRFVDPNPANPFVWYDVPGAGTLQISDWVYFNDQGLYAFDCIIVVTDNRFTATDIAILRNCARFNIPAYIVRSKSVQHIRNVLNDMPDKEDEDGEARMAKAREVYITQTKENISQNLDRAKLPQQRVYVIDKRNLVEIVAKGKEPKDMLDELDLLNDLLTEAKARRVRRSNTDTVFSLRRWKEAVSKEVSTLLTSNYS